jgi:hypothetical protein
MSLLGKHVFSGEFVHKIFLARMATAGSKGVVNGEGRLIEVAGDVRRVMLLYGTDQYVYCFVTKRGVKITISIRILRLRVVKYITHLKLASFIATQRERRKTRKSGPNLMRAGKEALPIRSLRSSWFCRIQKSLKN